MDSPGLARNQSIELADLSYAFKPDVASPSDSRVASAAPSIAPILKRDGDVETPRPSSPVEQEPAPADSEASTLPPADGGRQAWSFLFGSFLIEACCVGPPFSFSVFQVSPGPTHTFD